VGEQAAATWERGEEGVRDWYAAVFGSVFLREDATSLRFELRHADSRDEREYRRGALYLYQRVGNRSLLRLGWRYYDDDTGFDSQAWGVKLRHYFSARVGAHLGYRNYDHSEGADFETFLAGLDVLL
jgi:hypothetical protein